MKKEMRMFLCIFSLFWKKCNNKCENSCNVLINRLKCRRVWDIRFFRRCHRKILIKKGFIPQKNLGGKTAAHRPVNGR